MGWISEGTSAPQPWYKWQTRFLALKGAELYIFELPPVSIHTLLFIAYPTLLIKFLFYINLLLLLYTTKNYCPSKLTTQKHLIY